MSKFCALCWCAEKLFKKVGEKNLHFISSETEITFSHCLLDVWIFYGSLGVFWHCLFQNVPHDRCFYFGNNIWSVIGYERNRCFNIKETAVQILKRLDTVCINFIPSLQLNVHKVHTSLVIFESLNWFLSVLDFCLGK